MPLDPQVQTVLGMLDTLGIPPMSEMTVEQSRETYRTLNPLPEGGAEPVGDVTDRTVPGPAGDIGVRVYTPAQGSAPFPVVVFFHGGGWVIGDLETHDGPVRALANLTGAMVVAVDYRLAPEHVFPAALDDCYAATVWVGEHAAELGGDPARLVVLGDSAGGNLAAGVALRARDRGAPHLVGQVLVYPVTDTAMDTPSYAENGEGYFLEASTMRWFFDHYVPHAADRAHPDVALMRVPDLSGLPPAIVLTAEYDPLRDEGEAYAAKLREAGVTVTLRRYDGLVHGFIGMGGLVEAAQKALSETAAEVRELLAG